MQLKYMLITKLTTFLIKARKTNYDYLKYLFKYGLKLVIVICDFEFVRKRKKNIFDD